MPTLAQAILENDEVSVMNALRYGAEINCIDEYGFTPLIEATIADSVKFADLLLNYGADVNLRDVRGGSALHWAAENNNLPLAGRLLEAGADANAYSLSGQPVLTMPFLRNQRDMQRLLRRSGASLEFVKDYVNTKLLGHLFELIGTGCIVSPEGQLVEVDFEGFFPEVTLAMIADSLQQYGNHYAARRMRQFSGITGEIVEALQRAQRLIQFQQYRTVRTEHQAEITLLMNKTPLVLAVSYEGHAITFIHWKNWLVKCDRREDSRLFDNIVIYQIGRPERFTTELKQEMIYKRQSFSSINEALPAWLALQPVVELPVPAQVSGNCSWANVEACIPAIFYLLFSETSEGAGKDAVKKQALRYFHEWREWNRDRALQFARQRFTRVGKIRQGVLAETLAAILFQCCNTNGAREMQRADEILDVLLPSDYVHVLHNYVRVYAFEDTGEEGRRFLSMLTRHGFDPRALRDR